MNMLSPRRMTALVGILSLVALVALATPAAAQVLDANIEITAAEFTQPAMPMDDPATTNITITYDCGGLDGDTPITVTADENVSGASATISPASITPVTAPDCNPGDAQTSEHTLSVSVGKDSPAGEAIPVKIEVAGENALGQPQPGDLEVAATTGPYVDVTFTPKTDAFEVPAGESALVVIQIQTDSNVEIMAMPSVKSVPEGWSEPDLFPMNVGSPLVGGNGTGLMEFEIFVPRDAAPGDHTVEIALFAHSVGDSYLASENETLPLTISVVPATTNGDDDTEEGPGLAPFPLAVLAAAGLAFLRRRT